MSRSMVSRWSKCAGIASGTPPGLQGDDANPILRGHAGFCGAGSLDTRIRGLGKPVELVHPFIVGDLAEQVGD